MPLGEAEPRRSSSRVTRAGEPARAAGPAQALLLAASWPRPSWPAAPTIPSRRHRREITVVFLDLRGFTAFAETAEPEEVMGVLREYHAEMGRLILEHEGTLERFTGDGMMVFFNDPVPVPDAARPRRADGAGHARARERADAARLAQAGLRAGPRVSASPRAMPPSAAIGFEGRLDYGAIGTVTNLASRLCGEAKPGQILVARRVAAQLEAEIEVEAVGDLTLKGFGRPVSGLQRAQAPRLAVPRRGPCHADAHAARGRPRSRASGHAGQVDGRRRRSQLHPHLWPAAGGAEALRPLLLAARAAGTGGAPHAKVLVRLRLAQRNTCHY